MSIEHPAPHTRLGQWGEQYAANYLSELGWQVVERNWRCPHGELDLVALEPVADGEPIGVAVEVKCRSQRGFGDPLEAITYAKLIRLRQLAGYWAANYGRFLSGVRVDAIGIVKLAGRAPELRHLRGAQ